MKPKRLFFEKEEMQSERFFELAQNTATVDRRGRRENVKEKDREFKTHVQNI